MKEIPSADLSGKNILVTGGSVGIGFSSVLCALQCGANVLFCARTEELIKQALERFEELGFSARVRGISADVSDEAHVQRVFDSFSETFGRLDGVIHAAGVLGEIGTVDLASPQEWKRTIDINLFGTFLVVQQACRAMRKAGGRIVLLSGGGASGPFPHYTAYACSKVAVVRFAETVAAEMASAGVEINCLAPGFVPTRMHEQTLKAGEARAGAAYVERTQRDLAAGGVPAEFPARAAAFLLSDRCRGITGKFIAPVYDHLAEWPEHLAELQSGDLFTLRRILPSDRSLSWQ